MLNRCVGERMYPTRCVQQGLMLTYYVGKKEGSSSVHVVAVKVEWVVFSRA